MFIGLSLLDLIGIGLIGPYIQLILNTDGRNELTEKIIDYTGVSLELEDILLYGGLLMVFVFLTKSIVAILINKEVIRYGQNQEVRLRSFLMNAYQRLPYVEYLKRNSSEYIYSIQSLTSKFSGYILIPFIRSVGDIIVAAFIIILLAWQDIYALLVLVGLLSFVVFVYDSLFRHRMKLYGKKLNEASTCMVKNIQEGISGLKEIRILGKERYFYDNVISNAKKQAFYNLKSQLFMTSSRYLVEIALVIFVVFLVGKTIILGESLNQLAPTLGMFGVAAIRLIPIASSVSSNLVRFRYGEDTVFLLSADIKKIKDHDVNVLDVKSENIKTSTGVAFKNITLENINFSFPKSSTDVLKNISIKIKSGDSIGFMGASGGGKTTLINILLGLLTPTKGRVLYNGNLLNQSINEWQSNIAYLPQEIFLTDNTLKQNIALGVAEDEVDISRLHNSIQKARLSDMLSNLKDGIDTVIGEHGVRLSGGQRQRVALARAFYHNRSVLVMDESTSALDNETEQEIVQEVKLLKGSVTMIIIAHRITTLQHCDKIYEINGGETVNVNSYEDLVMQNKYHDK